MWLIVVVYSPKKELEIENLLASAMTRYMSCTYFAGKNMNHLDHKPLSILFVTTLKKLVGFLNKMFVTS